MLLFEKIKSKRLLLAILFAITLTSLSYLSALGSGRGILSSMFLVFRFPTHTLFWDVFSETSFMYRLGLVINIVFWSIIFERVLLLISHLAKRQ